MDDTQSNIFLSICVSQRGSLFHFDCRQHWQKSKKPKWFVILLNPQQETRIHKWGNKLHNKCFVKAEGEKKQQFLSTLCLQMFVHVNMSRNSDVFIFSHEALLSLWLPVVPSLLWLWSCLFYIVSLTVTLTETCFSTASAGSSKRKGAQHMKKYWM